MPEEEVIPPATEELLPPKPNSPKPTTPQSPSPVPTKKPLRTPNSEPQASAKRVEYVPQTVKKTKPNYKYVDKRSLYQILKETLPKHLVPTNRMGKTLGIIFLVIVMIALVQFPFGEFMSGNLEAIVKVGWPWPFLEFGLIEVGETPLILKYLIIDLAIYIFIAYIVDVIINVILDMKVLKSQREIKAKPKEYKSTKQTVADKLTKKVFTK